MYSHPSVPLISSFNSSITELLGALCDCSLNDVSWKRHGHTSQDGARRTLKKHAYEALLSRLFQYAPQKVFLSERSSISTTPPKNKVLMISLDLRVAGCQDKAEKLETQLGKLSCGITFWLKELDSVLELLVQLAGSMPQGPTVFSRDYMRRERPVLRKPLLGGYQSDELQRLEAHAWSLVCAEEWAKLGCVHGELGLMDAPLRTGLKAPGTRYEVEEGFEKETRLSLFGALHHTRTSDLDIKLDLPSVPRNADDIGLSIKVPPSLNQSEDEGFQSASNLTPDSQLNPVPTTAIDFWEAFQTFVPERSRYWERVGCSPGKREVPFLTEGGREAFDQLYWLSEEQMRVVNSTAPSPTLSLPLDFQNQLVGDVLNMLIGVASVTFPLNQVSLQFYVRPGVCISGTSAETVSRLLVELAQYGTHYVRLSCFSLQSENKKGLVIQAFSGGLRRCLHYYRACVLSTLPTLSLLTISFLFCKMGRQLRYLSELCCVDGACGKGKDTFPMGVKLLSYLYNEAQSNCSNENYPVLLSLLKSSCEPYTRFVSDWVYSGMFRDVYGEFMIQVNEDYLNFRDKHFWVQGYTLISKDVEDCVPVFLRHIAKEVYVCGKTINLLKICCPQHYICWSELSVPRIAVTFSLQEVEEIERDCAVYRGRMERIAKHNITSREEQALRTEQARQELINQVRQSAAKTLENICLQQVSHRLAEESKKKERFKELKQHLEKVQEKHSDDMRKAEDDDYRFARELRDREKRLKSIEEQLKQKARKDLIAQYSSLSEEAARKESRAVWRVQRMRLNQARAEFLQHDRQQIEAMLAESLLVQEEGCADQFIPTQSTQPEEVKLPTQENTKPNGSEKTCLKATALPSISTPTFFCPLSSITHPETASNTHTISEDVNFHKPLTMPLWPLNSQQMDQSLLENNRIKVPKDTFPPPSVLYDFNTPFSLLEVIATPVQPKISVDGDASPDTPKHFLSNFSIEANTSQLTGPIHCLSGQATKPSMGQYVPDVPLAQGTKGSVHGQPSMSSVDLSDMSGTNTEQNKNRIHMTVIGNKLSTSDPEDTIETNNRKTAKIRKGNPEWVDLTSTPPKGPPSSRTQEEGSESGNELSLISHSCVIPELFPKNIKSQCSDANIEDVDLVSKVFAPSPTPNNPNNVSNASLKIGKLVCHIDSLKSQPNGCSNLNSISPSWHNSESTLDEGSVVPRTVLTPSQLHGNAPGRASDRTLGIECELSETEPISSPLLGITYRHAPDSTLDGYVESAAALLPSPLMGGTYGHSSDSKLGDWCVVLGADLSPMPLPGSDYGHPSDSTLREGCLVSGTEPLPLHLPGRSYGHSSDSALGVGCVVLGPELRPRHLPGSAYGRSSNSTLVVGCVVSGAEDLPVHHSGSDYGHSSDSTLGQGCVVSGAELLPMHLPGSACEHFTNSNPGVECVVSREDLLPMQLPGSANVHSSNSALVIGGMVSASELQPMRLPGSAYWHSDFMLAGGCVVSGTEGLPMRLQDSDYSHSSNSTCGVHCLAKPRGNRDQQGNSDELLLRKGITVSTASYDGVSSEKEFLLYLAAQYQVEHYEDCYNLMSLSPESQLLQQVTRGSSDLHSDISIRRATDTTSVQLSAMVSLPVLMKHSVTTPLITHVSLVNKAVVDYMFVELGVERHFEALRHFLLMEDGEFSQSLSDLLFEKLGCGQTPGELLTPLVLNSILSKALQYSLHGDSSLAANFTFALRFLPETFHPHAPDSLNCLELRYKVNWPLNIIITDSCMNKYNRLFSLLLQLKHMVWSLRDLWFHLKKTALMKGAAQSVQFRQMQLYRHEMQHFVKVIQGYIANQILQVSWSEFTAKLATASNLDAIHSMHADYLNRAIFRGLLTEKAAPVMNIIHSIFSLILKFRSQLIAHPWEYQHGEAVHPSFIAMQQSYNTFKYYSHFLFKVVTKLVNRGYQPHLEDFLLRINFNNYYKDF